MRHLGRILSLAVMVVLVSLAASAQIVQPGPAPAPAPAPIPAPVLPGTRLEPAAGGGWKLVCPPGCPKKTTTNHHGETNEFCDCDGDGQQDRACKIWLKTDADGDQTAICHPGCPGEGTAGGQQCSMHTVEKPDGTVYKYCSCV